MGRVCDRCGNGDAVIKLPAYDLGFLAELGRQLNDAITWGKFKEAPLDEFDLCRKCYKDLKKFMGEMKIKNAERSVNEETNTKS